MFVDEVIMELIAGKGGDGCTSFRREKYVAMGGPNGGNGGRGADIIFKVDKGLKTLIDLRYKKIVKGDKGVNGKGSDRHGANAEPVVIKVPEGTVVTDLSNNELICDLTRDGEECIISHGGKGGRGNASFATHDNPAPKFSEYGREGEDKRVKVELKVLADIGLVGLPSVGKSTILSLISSANPKIAAYHFTTLSPNLGVVKLKDQRTFVMADLPGLIEGASEGAGLGDKFLKHAERTKIIAHVIDMGAEEGRNPIEDYKLIRKELESYNDLVKNKKEVIIANKMDLPNAKDNLELFKKEFKDKEIIEISCMEQSGLDNMITVLADALDFENEKEDEIIKPVADKVVYTYVENKPFEIHRDPDGVWVVSGKQVEDLFKITKFTEDEGVRRFAAKLKKMGVDEELEKQGAMPGDDVAIMNYMFTFKE